MSRFIWKYVQLHLIFTVFNRNTKQKMNTMKLSKVAILALRGMDRATRKRIAQDMGVTEDTIYRWMRTNDDSFTKAANLSILRRELGLADSDLLEEDELSKIA